jgi:hypothetical protein
LRSASFERMEPIDECSNTDNVDNNQNVQSNSTQMKLPITIASTSHCLKNQINIKNDNEDENRDYFGVFVDTQFFHTYSILQPATEFDNFVEFQNVDMERLIES